MILRFFALIAVLALASCASVEDLGTTECPREGGIGGTSDCNSDEVT